jgi:hypothetical protein
MSKYQEDLDWFYNIIKACDDDNTNPLSKRGRHLMIEHKLSLQALVDKSKGMEMLKEYWEREHPDYHYFLEGLRDIVEKVMEDWSDK